MSWRQGKIDLYPRMNFTAEQYWNQYQEWQKSLPGISMMRAAALCGHEYNKFRQGVRNHQIALESRNKRELPDT